MKVLYFLIIIVLNFTAHGSEKKYNYFEIESDELMITENPFVSKFIGNAYVKNDVNELWGDKIIINYNNNNKIEVITAIGNVMIKRPGEVATGNKAIYNLKLEEIRIFGDVSVKREGNVLNGNELTVDLITSASIIKGSQNDQVSARVLN